ncbi:MAG TPA: UDP-N-acetylmuramate dehydrogenase [Bacteroidota bacterium]|nr:UDP-N-acetylmuramate dehydrogenase [Bacteroidota bacterium]
MSLAPPPCMTTRELLARHTTIGLGGLARWFARCSTADDIRASLEFARRSKLPVQVFSGGSNIIFHDEGFAGVVLQVRLTGFRAEETPAGALVTVGAGEQWDDVVLRAVRKGWSGIECLSGIPGSAGGTPVQNVGAYGQEVAGTIASVSAIDRETLADAEFTREECSFGYRESRFKGGDANRFIITGVRFQLAKADAVDIRYTELARELDARAGGRSPAEVREAVIALRKKKSMVIDPSDPNTRSVGSFFMNPIVPREFYDKRLTGLALPVYPAPGGVKLSAAWLVEHAGFPKGTRRGGAAISERHALAIVNRGGSTAEVLALAGEIERRVEEMFGVRLRREPVIVPAVP